MRISAINILLLFFSLAALLLCATFLPFPFPAELHNPSQHQDNWFQLLHISTNAAYVWRMEPVLAMVSDVFPLFGPGVGSAYFVLCLLSFYAGTLIFFHVYLEARHFVFASLNAFILCVLLLFFFGDDLTLFSSLAWFPWFLLVLCSAMRPGVTPGIPHYILLIFFALRVAKSANQLSPILMIASFLIACTLGKAAAQPAAKGILKKKLPVILLALLPMVMALYQAPAPDLPGYPQMARVVSHDGTSGMARPLIAEHAPIPVIDREYLRSVYAPLSLILLLAFALAVPALSKAPAHLRKFFFLGLGLVCIMMLDTLPAESISQISPLATFARMSPGLHFFPLLPLTTALVLFILLFILSQGRSLALLTGCTLFLFLVANFLIKDPQSAFFGTSILQDKTALKLSHAIYDKTEGDIFQKKVVASPSLAIVRNKGFWIVSERDRLQNTVFQNARPYTRAFTASHGTGRRLVGRLTDNHRHRRWSERKGFQDGTEWLHLTLHKPTTISGIEVGPGTFVADFPRGIQILYQQECFAAELQDDVTGPESEQIYASYELIADHSNWQGSILYTNEGFPYYTAQHDVKIYFPEEVIAQCLLIRQTGISKHFDWSVATLNLLMPSGAK